MSPIFFNIFMINTLDIFIIQIKYRFEFKKQL
nr:MAG TPA: hypothetical protein [Ackermannviridae sp.]